MRRLATRSIAAAGGMLAGVSASPIAAAAGYDSSAESLIGTLSSKLIVLAITIALIFEIALVYVLYRYRHSGSAPEPEHNARYHFIYLVAVALILIFIGVASLQTFGALNPQIEEQSAENATEVDVIAEQWVWRFEYNENVTTQGTLVLPVNETVTLRVTSEDVIHSFYAPELAVRRDANPNLWNEVTFTPTETGQYRVACTEYCGQGHSRMRASIRVVSQSTYDSWLRDQTRTVTANQTGNATANLTENATANQIAS